MPIGPLRCLATMISAWPLSVRVRVVDLVAVDEHHDVGVLLETADFAEVGEHRPLVGALLEAAVQLAERDHGHSSSRARIFRPRLISEISTWRFSAALRPVISCR